MSWDVDEVEFYETFAEIAADPTRGLNGAMGWAWTALHWTQQELRERDKEKPSPLVEELVLLRTELLEHARLAGMGSEREARLMAQLEEARRELQQERESVVRFLRQPPEKAKACDKPHRHEDGKPCLVLVPVDLDEAADLIEQGKHRIGSSDREP